MAATPAQLLAEALRIQQNIKPVIVPAVFPSADQTSKSVYSLDPKAFQFLIQALQGINSTTLVVIDGSSADSSTQLATALASDAELIVLTGIFNLTSSLTIKAGWRRMYWMNATINAILTGTGEGLFKLEDGTFLDIATRNSTVNLIGSGDGNSIFNPATENFTLNIDGGGFSGPYRSNLNYTGLNIRCIKIAAPQTAELLSAHFIALGITGLGVGEQFLDTGAPRLHVIEISNCNVVSNYLNVDTSTRNGLGFAGKQLYVNRHCTFLQATINGASLDGGPNVVLDSSLTADEIEISFVLPAGLGAVIGLSFSGRVTDQFSLTCAAGAGTTVALNLTSGATLILIVIVNSGVFDVSITTATALFFGLVGVRNVTAIGANTLGGSASLTGVALITAHQITNLGLFGGLNGSPHILTVGNIQGLIAGTVLIPVRLLPFVLASLRGNFSNLAIGGDLQIGPGFTNAAGVGLDGPVTLSSSQIGGNLDGPAGAGTEAAVIGAAVGLVGTATGDSPAHAVTLRASTGTAGANATISL